MSDVNWITLKKQSLQRAVRAAGFDLAAYDIYNDATKSQLQRKATIEAIEHLRTLYEEKTDKDLKEIKCGVYVIRLAAPFTIQYKLKRSNIIYIGEGAVYGRVKSHFQNKLFDFMRSLSGTDFDIQISEPKKRGGGKANQYYRQVEYELLREFAESIGGGKRNFPLLNKNAGSNLDVQCGDGWNKPLKNSGRKPKWILNPASWDEFGTLD